MPRKRVSGEESPLTPPERLLTVEDVQKMLGVGRARVFEFMRERNLPHIDWGPRTLRFDPQALAKWIRDQQQSA